MSDSDSNGSTSGTESGRESLWQRLRNRFGRGRDIGLRESLAGAIEKHIGIRFLDERSDLCA